MTAQKSRITAALAEIGAAWAVTQDKCVLPDDSLDDQAAGRATYHIHPDQSEPRLEYIQRFCSLRELEAWIAERRPPKRRKRREGTKRYCVRLTRSEFKMLRQRYGSLDAAVEHLVKKELEQ